MTLSLWLAHILQVHTWHDHCVLDTHTLIVHHTLTVTLTHTTLYMHTLAPADPDHDGFCGEKPYNEASKFMGTFSDGENSAYKKGFLFTLTLATILVTI